MFGKYHRPGCQKGTPRSTPPPPPSPLTVRVRSRAEPLPRARRCNSARNQEYSIVPQKNGWQKSKNRYGGKQSSCLSLLLLWLLSVTSSSPSTLKVSRTAAELPVTASKHPLTRVKNVGLDSKWGSGKIPVSLPVVKTFISQSRRMNSFILLQSVTCSCDRLKSTRNK